ncbi:aminotransferase class I/II-fold pyridoxal phosphate-dependent enzyme [Streptomyces chartreusis]|uniref:aminotransferase class I/II-fold pyridoxal phosphate-dependent enzyme n=1 Tax=Streptomyces chartreusis TaxID=1969 RepID=UPI0033A260AF
MKRAPADLALFGGAPAFPRALVVGRPNTGDRSRFGQRLEGVLDSGWLSNGGPLVAEFERRVADVTAAAEAVATCNATTALQLVIRALGLTGQIIVPAMTFAATAQAVSWLGLTPVFCDIDPDTGCLSPKEVEAAITPRTSAIISVHLWGRPGAVTELEAIAAAHRLALVFDAAHAFGNTYRQRPIGQFGTAEVFSFHATKVVNAFEGGAVTTNDAHLARRLRTMQNFGLDADRTARLAGTNAKMHEASAAMGLTSLEAYDATVARNAENHRSYCSELAGVPGISVVRFDPEERHNHHYLIITVDPDRGALRRDALMDVLRAENVIAQRYFAPGCHLMPAFRSGTPPRLPHTEWLSDRVVALPTGPSVSRCDIGRVCEVIRVAARHGAEVTERSLRLRQAAA